jgi:NAD+ kinase
MKKFYMVVNTEKENAENVQKTIEEYLTGHGCVVVRSDKQLPDGDHYTSPEDVPEDTDCVITLGGDGTLIQAARDLAARDLPLIGINTGHLGYLTQMGQDGDIEELLDSLIADRCQIQDRMMLSGRVFHEGNVVAENIALNEIVMTRKGELRVLKFKIYVDGQFLYEYSADGMIVATPTGSTAYNLSAGGPIAQPDGSLIILTPICPHTLTSRTIVLGAESRIKIEISMENRGTQNAVFDGDTKVEMGQGDYIEIGKSALVTKIVKLDNRSFLDILKSKMA